MTQLPPTRAGELEHELELAVAQHTGVSMHPKNRRRIVAGAVLAVAVLAAIAAGPAGAHTGTGTITCPSPSSAGKVSFAFASFPKGLNVVNVDVTVDGLTAPSSGKGSFTGSSGTVDKTFTIPADGVMHKIVAVATWQQDGGGTARVQQYCSLPVPVTPPTPAPPACGTTITCPPPVTIYVDRTVTIVQQVPAPLCTSDRTIRSLVRVRYPGASNTEGFRVLGIDRRVLGPVTNGARPRGVWTGLDADGHVIPTGAVVRADGRIQLTIVPKGLHFSGFNNDLRTTVNIRTTRGTYRVIYRSAVCRSQQGNPNDQGSRAPVIPVRITVSARAANTHEYGLKG